MIVEKFQIKSGDHEIAGVLSLPEGSGPFPCAILSHGLVSSKESSKYIYLSEHFCAMGIAACRFDYHGCGESGGDLSRTTLTTRIGDLEAVLEHVSSHPLIGSGRIGALGSSFGGATTLVEAARNKSIRCVALWATPYLLDEKEDTSISGITLERSIYTDFATYDLLHEAQKVSRGIVVHGEMDEVVPCGEGKAIYARLMEPKKFLLIEGADHTFTDQSHRDRAAEASLDWFKRFLL